MAEINILFLVRNLFRRKPFTFIGRITTFVLAIFRSLIGQCVVYTFHAA